MRRIRAISPAAWSMFVILAVGAFLRFYRLGYQSFWLDELHTVIEADPSLSWRALLDYLKCCDQHPPLFFFAEKIMFTLFGSSELSARFLPALLGTWSIWLIYLLGKELYSQRMGIVAALLTCVNIFHIQYAQEARPYSLLFAAACGSFLYFIRLLKDPSRRHAGLYIAFTLLMIGTHYFGMFAGVAQAIIGIVFVLSERDRRKPLLNYLTISAGIILFLYSPWIPYLFSISGIRSFWIAPISPGFAVDYFHQYFGSSDLLKPFALLFLLIAMFRLLVRREPLAENSIYEHRTLLAIVCFLWIGICYLLPYLRSVVVVPMLYPRYTIVVLPAFMILLAFGIESISSNYLRYILLATFCLISVTDLMIVKRHYTSIHKAQFRELAKLINADKGARYPVISDVTGWHEQYYLRKYGFAGAIIRNSRSVVLDSILAQQGSHYKSLPGFWLSDAHGGAKPDSLLAQRIDSSFMLIREQDFYGAWAQLYISRHSAGNYAQTLSFRSFPQHPPVRLDDDSVVAIWDQVPVTAALPLKSGLYSVNLMLKGTPVSGVYPHIIVRINDAELASFYLTEGFENYPFKYRHTSDTLATLELVMDNDARNPAGGEDRNAFIKSVSFLRTGM